MRMRRTASCPRGFGKFSARIDVAFQPFQMSCPKESRMAASGTSGDRIDTI
jgi:hypothetical protein